MEMLRKNPILSIPLAIGSLTSSPTSKRTERLWHTHRSPHAVGLHARPPSSVGGPELLSIPCVGGPSLPLLPLRSRGAWSRIRADPFDLHHAVIRLRDGLRVLSPRDKCGTNFLGMGNPFFLCHCLIHAPLLRFPHFMRSPPHTPHVACVRPYSRSTNCNSLWIGTQESPRLLLGGALALDGAGALRRLELAGRLAPLVSPLTLKIRSGGVVDGRLVVVGQAGVLVGLSSWVCAFAIQNAPRCILVLPCIYIYIDLNNLITKRSSKKT
jgi:hypothetical protein